MCNLDKLNSYPEFDPSERNTKIRGFNKIKVFSCFLLLGIFIVPALALSEEKYRIRSGHKVFESVSNGLKFFHFQFELTPNNTVMPTDARILRRGYEKNAKNYRMAILDEKSEAFKHGMFQVFLPAGLFPFTSSGDGYVILRMPQTLSIERRRAKRYVQAKQDLFYRIRNMVENRKGSIDVIIELPGRDNLMLPVRRNVFFRSGGGAYINYVGQYKGVR